MVTPNCYIEFRVVDKKRFEILLRFFEPLKKWTQNPSGDDDYGDADKTVATRLAKEDTQDRMTLAREETRQRRNFAKPEEWLLAFRPQDLTYLGMPNHRDSIQVSREWNGLARRERRQFIKEHDQEGQLQMLADFVDMMKHWQDIEYELVACEMHESDRAKITYSTFKYPFEGKVALEQMLLFFGFFSVISDSC